MDKDNWTRKQITVSQDVVPNITHWSNMKEDRLCGLVVRVSGYRSRCPGLDSRPFQIFWEAAGLERGSTQPREDNWGATWR
jgi:hypothetical protein